MPHHHRRSIIVAALALAVTLAACGSDSGNDSSSSAGGAYKAPSTTTTATTTADATGGAATLKLSAEPNAALAFDTDTLSAKAGKVTIDLANPADAGIPHAIAIEGQGVDKDGEVVQPGGTSTVTATLKPGKYVFYCPVPGHRAGGMQGTLTVN